MRKHGYCLLYIAFMLSACGRAEITGLPSIPFMATVTPEISFSLQADNTEEQLPTAETATQPVEPTASLTPAPTVIPPTPTETLVPAPELPTELPRPPARLAWSGMPTYPGDSTPGFLFRLDYDPELWAQATNAFGDIVLANRGLEYCMIAPWTGRGLPVDWKTTHEFRAIGSSSYDVNIVSAQGQVKFITYTGGEGRIMTGFQVSFNENPETCVQAAEEVLGTLRSFSAIPTVTITP